MRLNRAALRTRILAFCGTATFVAFGLIGCGTSNNVYSALPLPGPTQLVPVPGPTQLVPGPTQLVPASPVPVSATATGSAGSTISTATVISGSTSAVATLPAASSGSGSFTLVASTTPPGSAPVLQSFGRQPLASTAGTPVLYFALTFASTTTFPSLPAFTVTLGSAPTANTAYYMGFFDPSVDKAYELASEGPSFASGTSVAFGAPSGARTFTANTTYVFALYSNTLAAAPASLTFNLLGPANAQTFTLANATSVATTSNANVATVTGPTAGVYSVVAVGGGTATISVPFGSASVTVPVTVNAATFLPQ